MVSARCPHELPGRHRRLAGLFSGGFRPTPGFLSLSKVRPATSAQVLPAKHCCSRRIVG